MNEKVYMNVKKNVANYFRENLPNYKVEDILQFSDCPGDDYLYMVIVKNMNYPELKLKFGGGPWVCWTCWNDKTQSLNYGHYDLKSYDQAFEVCMEYRRK